MTRHFSKMAYKCLKYGVYGDAIRSPSEKYNSKVHGSITPHKLVWHTVDFFKWDSHTCVN